MRQKFEIMKSENHQLKIREFAELDKETFSLLCEEEYAEEKIKTAIKEGKEALVNALRTKNMYPPGIYAEKIADTVIRIFNNGEDQPQELLFNDVDLLAKVDAESMIIDKVDD
jgi:hypothetical protein